MLKHSTFVTKVHPTYPSLLLHTVAEAFEYFKEQGFVDESRDYVVLYQDNQWELHELS